ncbi:hypothetical protein F9K75_21505 [Brucella intermedia]|nr:hypothetical protein F9K75_21505 [Brucella intermedia]
MAALEGVGIAVCFDRSIIFSSKLIFKNHCYECRTREGLIRLPLPPGAPCGSYPNRTLRNPIACHIQALPAFAPQTHMRDLPWSRRRPEQ